MGVLTVYLDKITDLRDSDGVGKSDPYVMLNLKEDRRMLDKSYGKKKSKTIKDTVNPVFSETFTFNDVPSDMENLVLDIKVMDDDFGRDDKIGSTELVLKNFGFSAEPRDVECIVDDKGGRMFKKTAKMHLKISYTE